MRRLKTIGLFLVTNLAILITLGIVLNLIGFESYMDEQGRDLNHRQLLVFCAVFGMGGAFLNLLISKWMVKRMLGVRILKEPRNEDEQWLLNQVALQAQAAGIRTPQTGIYESADPNAFATGASRNKALVGVSTGLLQSMPRGEVDAVLAHEISHVANGDMITLTLIQGVVNTFVMFFARIAGHFVDRMILKNDEGRGIGFWVATIAFEIVFGILASLIVLSFSRKREFRADAGAARLVGSGPMIAALKTLGHSMGGALPEQVAAFGISGKRKRSWIGLFSTHPTIAQRIRALERL